MKIVTQSKLLAQWGGAVSATDSCGAAGRRLASLKGLVAIWGCCSLGILSGCAGSPAQSQSPAQVAPHDSWSPDVVALFELDHRDCALQALLSRDTSAELSNEFRIKQVVVAPQHEQSPLIVVFVATSSADRSAPGSGEFMIFQTTGELIHFPGSNNWLGGTLEDLTGDGTLELVDVSYSRLTGTHSLTVIPLQAPFEASLQVAWTGPSRDYRIHRDPSNALPSLQIIGRELKQERVLADYRWDRDRRGWWGPKGSQQQGFLLVQNDEAEAITNLVGQPTCLATLQHEVSQLDVVEQATRDLPADARWSGMIQPAAPAEIRLSLGVVEDAAFSARFEASVVAGKMALTGGGEAIDVPLGVRRRIEAACKIPESGSYPRLAPPRDRTLFALGSL